MALFEGCSLLLELKNLPFKEKTKIKSSITENGGHISFVINKQCSLVVTNDVSKLTSRLHRIQKYQTPVVGLDYVHSCLERNVLLPVDEFKLDISSPFALSRAVPHTPPQPAPLRPPVAKQPRRNRQQSQTEVEEENGNILDKFRVYRDADQDLPEFSEHFHVAKYSIFQKGNRTTWCVLELQSYCGDDGQKYRVVRYWMEKKHSKRDMLVYPTTSEEAVEIYKVMMENQKAAGLKQEKDMPPQVTDFGSSPLQQLLLEEKLSTGVLSHSVGVFVELLWTEAQGCLDNTLQVPIDKLSINDVSRAEGLLIQVQREMKKANHPEVASLMAAVYTLLPHKVPPPFPDPSLVSQKLDLCQLIRDVLNVKEMSMSGSALSCLGKYRALRCSIEEVANDSSEFQTVTSLLERSCDSDLEFSGVNIQQILRVTRGVELQTFRNELGNIKSLFHSSTPRNFVGILSRGLLLPRVGVEDHGIIRTDGGNLGGGIYFSDSMSTCIGYSKASDTDGSRLMLVCDVALGSCKDVYKKDYTLTQAPEGHTSVHAVRKSPRASSEFEHDEFVVYSPDQVRLKYVVQFSCSTDSVRKFSPSINLCDEKALPSPGDAISEKDIGIDDIKNPLEDMKAGLLDSKGQQLPLQAVNVKCRLKDLLSQVIIFQKYTNLGTEPIEAKYVFPLDDSAAVCGFEAFINGKHVVGQVKEKERARQEYKQAVEKGHGAYLMDQDAPDVFTISVGNLPPGATVIIKVTFVSELVIKDGSVFFSLPGSVAPWQESAALNQTTQVTLDKVCITDETASKREFTLDMAIEMPYDITRLHCVTHEILRKKTDCKAVVSLQPGQVMGPEGFQLFISLSAVHLPRMWVENHPDKDSQACMLVFYPNFESSKEAATDEVILLLDVSESMRGGSLHNARMLALHIIKTLDPNVRVNVVVFGTDHSQAFLAARPLAEAGEEAERFIKAIPQSGGSTELWRPLRLLNLLPPSRGTRNLLLLSDGHIQNGMLTLQMLRDNARHSRLFTCGLSTTANRHMLRALAQAGGGAYEYFDTKTKHTWKHKVASQVQRMSAPSCSSVSVKWQQFNPAAPSPVQAPKRLQSLFNDCHTLVFGFVPHCTQATLLGNLSGQELNTMVSTSELQKTKGTFLHKLTARAIIRDYEDGSLDFSEPIQEGKKSELKSYIIELSKEFSILSQFTSFVAIEERDTGESEKGYTDIAKLLAEEDVDILSYMSWDYGDKEEEEEEGEDLMSSLLCAGRMLHSLCTESWISDFDVILGMDGDMMMDLPAHFLGMNDDDYHQMVPTNQTYGEEASLSDESSSYGEMEASLDSPPTRQGSDSVLFGAVQSEQVTEKMVGAFGRTESPGSSYSAVEIQAPRLASLSRFAKCQGSSMSLLRQSPPDSDYYSEKPVIAGFSFSGFSSCPPPPPPPPSFSGFSSCPPPPPPPPSFSGFSSCPPPPPPPPSFSGFSSCPPPPPPPPSFSGFSSCPPPPPPPPSFSGFSSCPPPPPPPPSFSGFSSCPPPPPPPMMGGAILSSGLRPFGSASFFTTPPYHPTSPSGFSPPSSLSTLPEPMSLTKPGQVAGEALESIPLLRSVISDHSLSPHLSFFPDSREKRTKAHFQAPAGPPVIQEPQQGAGSMPDIPLEKMREEASRTRHTFSLALSAGAAEINVKPHLHKRRRCLSLSQKRRSQPLQPEDLHLKWTEIFKLQLPEGFWESTAELGQLINVDLCLFADVFLKSRGINSLGEKARVDILRLVATLLVLQLMRVRDPEFGRFLHSLFNLSKSTQHRPEHWEQLKRAVDWVIWADRQYPCICSRLEFGVSWESSTRQLLGFDSLPPFSPLQGLNLRNTRVED
ncbi:protein mono-ADP-ribosyltransferase PARP4 [Synchiropus splendidus]|uniref:protein mono-ADP-ribosyltransferase PARP4 n=1 Tax=Synchiropus splendidus TaxID=270530 RepID=UPI00237D9296|nr:protein mono-ADP-ribosyltransferase PARP4 [Synchiropus splendidus]